MDLNHRPRGLSPARSFTELPARMSPKKGNRRQMPPDNLLSRGSETDRHERPVKGRVRLENAREPHAGEAKAVRQLDERALGRHGEDHGVGAGRELSRGTLARRVRDLGGLYPSRKIGADYDVVGQVLVARVLSGSGAR